MEAGKTTVIDTLPLTDSTELVFYLWRTGGSWYGGFRKYVLNSYSDSPVPTRSGVVLGKQALSELVELLEANRDALLYSQDEGEVFRCRKNASSSVVVSLVESTVDDEPLCIDIRVFQTAGSYRGPTKQGVRISREIFDMFLEAARQTLEGLTHAT